MIEYYKNYILCAELQTYYCLVCKEPLDKDILDLHISLDAHKQNANRQICLANYSNDSIYQIGDINYCQVCNYIIKEYDKIEIHINTESHNENKKNPEAVGKSLIPKRMEESIDIGNNIVVSLLEWHGINKYNCLICDPGVTVDIIEHIDIESHVLNMMNTVTKYDHNRCYRQFNDETIYCFVCKTIIPSSLLLEHWSCNEHNIGKEDEQKNMEVKLEETGVEKKNIEEKGTKIDRDYCIVCNTITPSPLLLEHWCSNEHNIGKEDEQKKIEVKLEETGVEKKNVEEKGTKIDRDNKIKKDKKVGGNKEKTQISKKRTKTKWIPMDYRTEPKQTKMEEEESGDMNVEKNIDQEIKETKEQNKQEDGTKIQEIKEEMSEKLGDKKEEEDDKEVADKIQEEDKEVAEKIKEEVKQIKEENKRKEGRERKEEEQKLQFHHSKQEMKFTTQGNEAEKSEKGKVEIIEEESQRLKEVMSGLVGKEIEDRKGDKKEKSERIKENIYEATGNIQANKTTEDISSKKVVNDLRMKLFQHLTRNFDINFDNFEAKCKLCQQYVDMNFQGMVDHYKKHMKEVKNYYVTKTKSADFETIYDHGKARSELAKFGRKHFMKLTQGGVKGYCSLCNLYVAPHMKNFEIHINGDRHTGHLAIKGLAQPSITNKTPEYKVISSLSYIKDISFTVTMQLAWVNKEFCITIHSFYLVAPYGPTKEKLKCFACDLEFPVEMLMLHVFGQMHQEKWYTAQVIVGLEKELFTREIRPGLYHCGSCNVVIPYWRSLQRHFSSVAHRDMNNEFQDISKRTNEWYSEIIQRGDNPASLLSLLDYTLKTTRS